MTFSEITKPLLEGKKVCLSYWKANKYVRLNWLGYLVNENNKTVNIDFKLKEWLKADEWKIYECVLTKEERKYLKTILKHCPGVYALAKLEYVGVNGTWLRFYGEDTLCKRDFNEGKVGDLPKNCTYKFDGLELGIIYTLEELKLL